MTAAIVVVTLWVSGIAVLVALCRAAARGDRYIDESGPEWDPTPRPPRPRPRKRPVTLADGFRTLTR